MPVVGVLLLVQLFFGLHYVAAKSLLRWIDPAAWALVRVAGAALLLQLLALRRPSRRPGRREWGRLAVFALFGVVLNQVLFIEGLSRTTPAHSALIMTMIPLLTILFAVLLGKERPTAARAAGLVLALAGVWILLHADRFRVAGDLLVGDLLTLTNATSYSLFLVISREYLVRNDPLVATARVFTLGAFGVAAYGLLPLSRVEPASLPWQAWSLAAFIIVFPTVGAYWLNYWALSRVASSMVALFIYLQPVIATASQWGLGQGAPGPRFYLAAVLVFAGVALGSLRRRDRRCGMLSDVSAAPPEVDCELHGRRRGAMCCRHVARESGRGFYAVPSEELARPQAWCAACDAALRRGGGWNEEMFEKAEMTLLCEECWDEARRRNEDRNPLRRAWRSLTGR